MIMKKIYDKLFESKINFLKVHDNHPASLPTKLAWILGWTWINEKNYTSINASNPISHGVHTWKFRISMSHGF